MPLIKKILASVLLFAVIITGSTSAAYAAACKPASDGLPLPTWYQYLPGETVPADPSRPNGPKTCVIKTDGLDGSAALLVMMGIFNIIMFIAGFAAVIFVVFGGFKLLTSTGEPQKIAAARTTILNALVGLFIAIIAAQAVGFIAARIV
jgi:hypothetical protein